jgi:hypothetical protein
MKIVRDTLLPLLLTAVLAATAFGREGGWSRGLRAGDQPGDLQIHVVGEHHDIIEVYFHVEGVDLDQFRRVPFPNTLHIDLDDDVILAPKNAGGTFALIYGKHRDYVKAFGWKAGTTELESFDLPVEPGYPVRLKWVTTQILKAQFGKGYSKECVVQFNAKGDQAWKILFSE